MYTHNQLHTVTPTHDIKLNDPTHIAQLSASTHTHKYSHTFTHTDTFKHTHSPPLTASHVIKHNVPTHIKHYKSPLTSHPFPSSHTQTLTHSPLYPSFPRPPNPKLLNQSALIANPLFSVIPPSPIPPQSHTAPHPPSHTHSPSYPPLTPSFPRFKIEVPPDRLSVSACVFSVYFV